MDWAAVFDEAYPQPGVTDAVIERFVTEVARPISPAEVREVNARQHNPFPPSDRLHATWQPFDSAAWVIPNLSLPPAYLSLLRWADGGEFRTGERWFQFFPALDEQHGIRAMMLAYRIPHYMPGAVPFAFNGDGTFYLFDMRQPSSGSEYPIVCARAGYLSWKSDACWVVADSFEAACHGTVNVDDVRHSEVKPEEDWVASLPTM